MSRSSARQVSGIVRLEDDEARGFRDGLFHEHHEPPHVDAVHSGRLVLQGPLTPDVDTRIREHGDDVYTFGIEDIALTPAGLVRHRERVQDAAPINAAGAYHTSVFCRYGA